MGKKFMGLGGTDHFWDRAKAWILNQITSAVTAKIAEVVANAPEDLDTLKEIADWISAHANDAAAMNTQITENKNNIAANSSSISAMNTQITENKNNIAANSSSISAMNTQITENKNNIATNTSDISALKTSVAGKADKVHTHSAGDITSGTLPIANGGTGVTTQADINKAFIGNLDVGESDVTDGTEFVSSYASDSGFSSTDEGSLHTPYKRQFIKVWNYIKGKISSVLGLTKDNYGGKAASAGKADVANALAGRGGITNTDTFQNVMNNDGKWYVSDLNSGWSGSFYSFHAGGSQSGLMFRIRGGSTDIRNIEVNYSIDSSRFAGPWTPLIGRIPTSAPSSPQDGDIWIER